MFAAISRRDVLLHHPYDSFATSVQRFIEQAAADPHVLAIKQTLYRTCGDSPIMSALIDAAEAGKQVSCSSRSRPASTKANIRLGTQAGAGRPAVVYGLVGLKTHAKLALVVRARECRYPALRPRRHWQLQPEDCAGVRKTLAC